MELKKGGTELQVKGREQRIKDLEKERDKLDARYGTDRFEEMIRMDVDLEEMKQDNLRMLRESKPKNVPPPLSQLQDP